MQDGVDHWKMDEPSAGDVLVPAAGGVDYLHECQQGLHIHQVHPPGLPARSEYVEASGPNWSEMMMTSVAYHGSVAVAAGAAVAGAAVVAVWLHGVAGDGDAVAAAAAV
eukprot:scpid51060/ scgid11222/ 